MKRSSGISISFANVISSFVFLLVANPDQQLAFAAIKRWVPNTNYDNPDNWNIGRLPCDRDNLTFAVNSPPIYIQNDVSIISMELPSNGELILGEGVVISAMASSPSPKKTTKQNDGTCQGGQEAEFIRTNFLEWLDPNNWCEASADSSDCMEKQPHRLDTERVPCLYDDAVFPTQSTFLVRLNDTSDPIKIKSIKISGNSYNTESLPTFLQSPEGRKQFNLEAKINVQSKSCEDVTGCSCGNDKGMIMHNICDLQSKRCPDAHCEGALRPKGHCCPVCGMVLTMDYVYGFKINNLKKKIISNFIKDDGGAYMIVSKLSNDRIQVLVLDTHQDGDQAKMTGNKIKKYIEEDLKGPKKLWVSMVSAQTSGSATSPKTGARKGGSFFHSAGSIAGVVLTILIVIIVIVVVAACFVDKTQCRKNFKSPLKLANPFRRFSSGSGKGDLEMDDSISYVDIMRATGEENTFDNPMYNIPVTSAPSIQEVAKEKASEAINNNEGPAILDPSAVTFMKASNNSEGSTSFANPLFGAGRTNPTIIDPTIRLNPIYTDEGIEEDSKI